MRRPGDLDTPEPTSPVAGHRRSFCLAVLAVTSSLVAPPAQDKKPPEKTTQPTEKKKADDEGLQDVWVVIQEYDEKTSRMAFSSCDDSGDDRLDLREAIHALPNMGSASKPSGFRELDANRNGFVHWDEFDARFRRLTTIGNKFLFRPSLPFLPAKGKEPVNPVEKAINIVMNMVADDEDPEISKTEFVKLLVVLKQPAKFATSFGRLDKDESDGLSAEELAPVIAEIPALLALANTIPGAAKPGIPKGVLQKRLGRIHPTLARWGKQIFRDADRDGDGKLSSKEIDPSAK